MKQITLHKSVKVMVIALTLISILLSCKKREDEVIVYGNAKFRLVNAVQGSLAQDFYQSDNKLSGNAVAYGDVTDYITVKAGNSVVSFKSTGTQNVNATGSIGVNTDVNYTVFYTKNSSGTGEIRGYAESDAIPPIGKAGVRFVNLGASLTSSIVVSFATGEPLTTGLVYGNITNYAALDPAVEMKFALTNSLGVTYSIPANTFQAGKVYTVWFDAATTATAQYHVVLQN